MLIAWAISSLRLLELPPMARNLIFDRLNDGIIVLDPKNRVVDANPAGQKLLGGDGAYIGMSLEAILPTQPALRRLFEAPGEMHGMIAFDGEPVRAFDAQSTPLTDRRGRVTGRVLVMRDISERIRLEESLQRATRDAEAGTLAQKAFLAMLGHELRTPLTGILGMAEVLQWGIQGPLTESQLRSLEVIESSGRQLNDRITDMLDYASLESGALTLTLEVCSAKAICESCLRALEAQFGTKQQSVTYTVTPANLAIRADARRLRQMVNKLLDNASKFTPEGGALGIEMASEAGDTVSITVWDNGIGIAAEDQERLFKPFVQLDSGLKRRYGGSGMSLAIVSALAAKHGGAIRMESNPGAGSRFTIELPSTWPSPIPARAETV
jgi:signal transduction histidine kinase